jgi:hypothetical protein
LLGGSTCEQNALCKYKRADRCRRTIRSTEFTDKEISESTFFLTLSFGIIAVSGTFFFLGNCRVKFLLKARPFFGDASAAFGNDSDAASTTIAEVPVAVREVALLNENDWLITQNVIQIPDLGSQDSAASHRVCLPHSGVKSHEEACTRLNLNRNGFNF